LTILVSQSGETADTLACLRAVKAKGQKIVAVVNEAASTIARARDIVAPTLAGPEIGVASTKAFTCQLAVLACLALAALSVAVLPTVPSYDPWSWIVWGREIIHVNLQTTGGPTWKPLPVIFTTVFALFGKAAPDLWLVVARAGAFAAVVMVFRLSVRLTRDEGLDGGRDVVTDRCSHSSIAYQGYGRGLDLDQDVFVPHGRIIGHVGTSRRLVSAARDSGIQVVRLLGAAEHVRERIRRCVTERAQKLTQISARLSG